MRRATLIVAFLLACRAPAQPPQPGRPIVDGDLEELARAFPELSRVRFESGQSRLAPLLRETGGRLGRMLDQFVDVAAEDERHTMRFLAPYGFESGQREKGPYTLRSVLGGDAVVQAGAAVSAPSFLWFLQPFLPRHQEQTRFRYLGRAAQGDRELEVVAYAAGALRGRLGLAGDLEPASFEGLAWIDAANHTIRRLQARPVDSSYQRLIIDVVYQPVTFPGVGDPLWLPAKAVVSAKAGSREHLEIHRLSGYRLDDQPGVAAEDASREPDAREALVNGIVLLRASKPAEAAAALREAVRLNPTAAEPHHQLGIALREAKDLAGAEAALRDAVKRAPDDAAGHNDLAEVLFARGDAKGAAAEFGEVIRIEPRNLPARVHRGDALSRAGDRAGAAEVYRAALALAPGNEAILARLDALRGPAPETQIRVEVRQVLVPVVVTGRDGHHVTGLRRSDFQVFEDGVEQAIAGFSVERSQTLPPKDVPAPAAAAPPPPESPGILPSYLICLDTLHATFANFVRVRNSLAKFFEREEPGMARYALVALGTQTEVLLQFTGDAAGIPKALDDRTFARAFTASRAGSDRAIFEQFRRDVEDTRRACDSDDPAERAKCESGKRRLPAFAESLAQESAMSTSAFLVRLRQLVELLGAQPGRKTLVLVSDGFLLSPGREGYGLLSAFFPEIREAGLRSLERLHSGFDDIVRLAAARNVRIDSIDSRGLYTSPEFEASTPGGTTPRPLALTHSNDVARESGDSLAELAAATGGLFVQNTNDLAGGIHRVLADGRETYVLAYVSTNAALDGKFRAITVKLRDPRLIVRAKRGYWATGN